MVFGKKLLRITLLSCILGTLFAFNASAACVGVGTVNASALRLRASASTDSEILATAQQNETVLILEQGQDGWCKVDYRTIEGYMREEYLNITDSVEADLGYGTVTNVSSQLNVRSGPGTGFERITALHSKDKVSLLGLTDGWFKISCNGIEGYVSADYITPCMDQEGNRADDELHSDEVSDLRAQVIAYAEQFIGCPYVWGGSGPKSFDCSGYTQYVMKQFGYSLIHGATSQSKSGVAVSRDELKPGDLVFFHTFNSSYYITHVGIYAGNDQFLHASSSKGITYTSLYSDYYSKAYVCARRIIND